MKWAWANVVGWPGPAAKHPPSHLITPPATWGRESEQQKWEKPVGRDWNGLISERKKSLHQVMQKQSLTTSHQQTVAQPVSKQQAPLKDHNWVCCWACCHTVWDNPWLLGVSCPGSVTTQLLVHLSQLIARAAEKQWRSWCCVITAQQWLKHQCVSNTLFRNPSHNT